MNLVGDTEQCSDLVAGIGVSGVASDHGVTQYANEACEAVTALSPFEYSVYLNRDVALQDLKSYFERPRLILVNTLANGSINFNQAALDVSFINLTSWFPQWTQRLSGAYGIKFSIVFTLQVAASPFHQCVLASAFQYGGCQIGTNTKYRRLSNAGSVTNLPHVRMDISETTMTELKVPFLYGNEFYPVSGIDQFQGNYGVWGLAQILGYQAVAALAAPTFKVSVHLQDVELFGADNNASTTITLQSGVMVKEARETQIVSKTLKTAAKVGNFVAKYVPALSAIAGPTAWALDIAGGVASYFGFSRPLLKEPPGTIYRGATAYEQNVDIPARSTAVGLMSSNTLAISTNFGACTVDEMALKFITSQFSQVLAGRITTTNLHGTVIYACTVSPSVFWFRTPATTPYCNIIFPRDSAALISASGNSFLPSSLMNISSYFRLWRGSITFRITFAKTKYHAGRYMISYNPKTTVVYSQSAAAITTVDGPETVAGNVQPYGYSQIMDLKDSNVFEFSVPYFCEQPYLTFFSSSGSVSIVCIDPLQAPSTVTSSVPFLVEVAGGEDYELADFQGSGFIPMQNATIYLQSGDISVSNQPILTSSTSTPCQDTIGECIVSVKQMIQHPTFTTSTVSAGSTAYCFIPPWFWNSVPELLGAAPAVPISSAQTWTGAGITCTMLSTMYAFARGSTDFHAYLYNTTEAVSHVLSQNAYPGIAPYPAVANKTDNQGNTNALPKVIANGSLPMHARLPAFQTLVRVPLTIAANLGSSISRTLTTAVPASFGYSFVGHTNVYGVQNGSAGVVRAYLSYAAGDDAMLAGYIGPEPVVIPNSVAVNSLFPGSVLA